MTVEKIRVIIADDHLVLAEGLGLFLSADPAFEVLAYTASGRQALELTQKHKPDVLLLDVRMPDLDGLQVLSSVKYSCPETIVIMLTSHRLTEYLSQAIALGATGFLSKEIGLKMIPQAIRAALEGEAVIDKSLLQEALQATTQFGLKTGDTQGASDPELTDQEYRILILLADGQSNDEIAAALSISRNTVKTHVSRVFEKLGVSDRTQAAIWAIRHGIAT